MKGKRYMNEQNNNLENYKITEEKIKEERAKLRGLLKLQILILEMLKTDFKN